MTDSKEPDSKKRLGLGLARPGARLDLRGGAGDAGQVRQSFPHGRTKTVQVEVKKKRIIGAPVAPAARAEPPAAPPAVAPAAPAAPAAAPASAPATIAPAAAAPAAAAPAPRPAEPARSAPIPPQRPVMPGKPAVLRVLTEEERAARQRALKTQQQQQRVEELRRREDTESARADDDEARRRAEDEARRRVEDKDRQRVDAALRAKAEDEKRKADEEARRKQTEEDAQRRKTADATARAAVAKLGTAGAAPAEEDDDKPRPRRPGMPVIPPRKPTLGLKRTDDKRRPMGKVSLQQALSDDNQFRARSLAAIKRRAAKDRQGMSGGGMAQAKIVREVVIPEAITVQELANRMAERGADVVKTLMKMGVMATINQTIDADTAELVVGEFGHKFKRVAESDVEIGIGMGDDSDDAALPRAPVVTIMGHVDHGKTSLLDALRQTDVAAHEAGGITQHIGAYQIETKAGRRITFLDTPGHEAFTAMRARGASVTDIVVLVVAADDGIQPQTIEAISHAKAAEVPLIVAINKIDKPGGNPDKVRLDLLQHDVALEGYGGDVLAVEVSALKKTNLDKLEDAILLQAEVLDLRANPERAAAGAVVEAKLDRGRGVVATVLVQKGTLRVGDIVVAGSEWGKVRALVDHNGAAIREAGPSMPVEVLGLDGTPSAGDDFAVVESEARAREITSFRQKRARDARAAAMGRGTLADMFSRIQEGAAKELGVVVKADVQGSVEAIAASIGKLGTDEVKTRMLHGAVGAITEGDVALAKASSGIIVGFNVRATAQARDIAKRDGVEIRYYSIIYNIIDDIKAALSGMLAPTLREKFLGNAEIRQVFDVSRSGKVAGCMVTEGMVKRGAKVRLLRDNVVIHEGTLKTLRRFKDEVREVQSGYECGMAFENYQDIRPGDVIEAFEIEEVARAL
ncbi:MAG: translation initiation factor IF-2 [Alphaproteobacteria bacterium]|nr:translation initiation factor IF-2 [Alphaproteobacteria bacterium]